jgi:hypothetical protein
MLRRLPGGGSAKRGRATGAASPPNGDLNTRLTLLAPVLELGKPFERFAIVQNQAGQIVRPYSFGHFSNHFSEVEYSQSKCVESLGCVRFECHGTSSARWISQHISQ